MPGRGPRYSEAEARDAIAASFTYAEALRRLGMCPTGNGRNVLRRYAEEVWNISTSHFDRNARRHTGASIPLEEILVEHSSYKSRGVLKRRLYESGLKKAACEMCGQGELWRGRHMSLILDHVNGVRDDNRLDNLRILCPNCNATLDTHCGRNARIVREPRACVRCDTAFMPRYERHRYCSRECGQRVGPPRRPRPASRRVERPPHEQLAREIEELGYLAVGRKYGVSDNAIRKWQRAYEGLSADVSDAARTAGPERAAPAVVSAPARPESPAPGTPATATGV